MPSSRLFRCLRFLPVAVALLAAPRLAAVPDSEAAGHRRARLRAASTTRAAACSPRDKADVQSEPASITKLMTAYGVFRALREKRLSLTDRRHHQRTRLAAPEGSRTFAQVGTQIPVEVLIKGMIVQSGNDATHRAGREVRRHRRRLRADDERVREASSA